MSGLVSRDLVFRVALIGWCCRNRTSRTSKTVNDRGSAKIATITVFNVDLLLNFGGDKCPTGGAWVRIAKRWPRNLDANREKT